MSTGSIVLLLKQNVAADRIVLSYHNRAAYLDVQLYN